MQTFRSGGSCIHFRLSRSPADRQTLVFINSLGTDFRIWDDVAARVGDRFDTLQYDKRGHGLSDLGPEPHAISDYARDVIALLDSQRLSRVILCGLSVGGLIALSIVQQRPGLVQALILSNTAAKIGTAELWNSRIDLVRGEGLKAVASGVMERWFSQAHRINAADRLALYRNMLERTPADGYVACCEAIRDADFSGFAAEVSVPTLCIAGQHDGATPPDLVKGTAAMIKQARFEIIEDAAHLPFVEQLDRYCALISGFANST